MDLNKMPKAERAAPMNVWNRRAVPLSAPVGVDDEDIARVFMSLRIPNKIAAGELITPEDWFDFGRGCAALARQPAAVDGAMERTKWVCTFCTGVYYLPSPHGRFCCEAQAKYRAALAQAPASGEAVAPFGYCADFETGLYECSHKFYYLAPGQPVPEGCTPFYTTPPAPVPAVRVTDELVERAAREVWKVDRDHWLGGSAAFLELHPSDYARLLAIARAALEAALGQGKENE